MHAAREHSSLIGPWCLAALLVATGQALAADVPLTMTAEVWKRDVILGEPILVKLELANPTDEAIEIVPACPWRANITAPLAIQVTSDDGREVPFAPPAFGGWMSCHAGSPDSTPLQAWLVPARGVGFLWIDLSEYSPIPDPGRYHLSLHYAPGDDHIRRFEWSGEGRRWVGALDADAGMVNVGAPASAEDKAAWASYGEVPRFFWGQGSGRPFVTMRDHPASTYALYAHFAQIQWGAFPPRCPSDELFEKRISEWSQQGDAPPFGYQIPLLRALRKWFLTSGCAAEDVGQLEDYRNGRTKMPENIVAARIAELEEAVPRDKVLVAQAAGELLAAAKATGDLEILQMVELRLWYWPRSKYGSALQQPPGG